VAAELLGVRGSTPPPGHATKTPSYYDVARVADEYEFAICDGGRHGSVDAYESRHITHHRNRLQNLLRRQRQPSTFSVILNSALLTVMLGGYLLATGSMVK
jgi:hypothetical protein